MCNITSGKIPLRVLEVKLGDVDKKIMKIQIG